MSKKSKVKMGGLKIGKWITELSPYVAFFQQITEKDLAIIQSNPQTANLPLKEQFKNIVNIVLGSVSGFNPFPNNYQKKFSPSWDHVVNKWSVGGVALMLYGEAARHIKVLPKGAQARAIGKRIAVSGAVAGALDPPTNTQQYGQSAFNNPSLYLQMQSQQSPPVSVQPTNVYVPNNQNNINYMTVKTNSYVPMVTSMSGSSGIGGAKA